MKLRNQIVPILLFIGVILTGCNKELIEPASNNQPDLQARSGIIHPDQQCGPTQTADLSDPNGVVLGSAELLNDDSKIYIQVTMNQGFFLESLFANFGTTADIPENNGLMVMEDFMFQDYIDGGKTNYTIIVPTATLPVCNDVVLHANVTERNMFGQTVATHKVWMGTNQVFDGYFFKFCLSTCN